MALFGFGRNKNNGVAQAAATVSAPNITVAKSVTLRKEAAPAIDRGVVLSKGGIDLAKRYDKAGFSLSKAGLTGIRAQAVMLLDHSYSMVDDYKNGLVQTLVDRALAFSAQIDIDGQLPIIAFDDKVYNEVDVDLNNFNDVVNRKIWSERNMSGTQMAPAFEKVRKMAAKTNDPIFLIVIGDGDPHDREETTRAVVDLARYPVFIKFLAIRPVGYLRELDNYPDGLRLLDNVNAQFISDPAGISDQAFADAMVEEWAQWVEDATAQGILN